MQLDMGYLGNMELSGATVNVFNISINYDGFYSTVTICHDGMCFLPHDKLAILLQNNELSVNISAVFSQLHCSSKCHFTQIAGQADGRRLVVLLVLGQC